MRAWFVGLGLGAFFLVVAACASDPASSSPTVTVPSSTTDGGASFAVTIADGGVDAAGDSSAAAPDAAAPDAAAPDAVTFSQETVTVNGNVRTYVLGTPSTYDPNRSYPLVMLFHGNPGTIASMMATQPFETVSQQDAIVAYLQAYNASGEVAGAYAWDLSITGANVDIPFVHRLPVELVTKKGLNIDTTKVYGYGHSGGAFFLQSLECVGADVFHAIGCDAGGVPNGGGTMCSSCSTNTVPTILIHGQADDVVGPASGTAEASCQANSSGCTATLADTTPTPCQLYSGCRSAVELCFVPGVAHEPPWTLSLPTAWAFFTAH